MKQVGEYPRLSMAHMEVAKHYSSPLLMGPPVCDELVALVEHMFTEDEADVVRHLKPMLPRTARSVARASGRPLEEVRAVLDSLAKEKFLILSLGRGNLEVYSIMPVVPGTFEWALVRPSTDGVTPWHIRFAELYEQLFSSGYVTDYLKSPLQIVRYLPVNESIANEPMAYPSDRLEAILERFDDFGVAVCQCRLARELTGEGCGKKLEACVLLGDWVQTMVDMGKMRRVSRSDVLEIKAEAESQGLVTWMQNETTMKTVGTSCSCCGCCCGALRSITEFNAPGMIAPPHFMPRIDRSLCEACGRCVAICQTKALTLAGEGEARRAVHIREKCIGCGLCAVACEKGAAVMRPVPGYREPRGMPALIAQGTVRHMRNSLGVTLTRRRERLSSRKR